MAINRSDSGHQGRRKMKNKTLKTLISHKGKKRDRKSDIQEQFLK
jgi:hypothetical protein